MEKHEKQKEIEARLDDLHRLKVQLKFGGREMKRPKKFDLLDFDETNTKSNTSVYESFSKQSVIQCVHNKIPSDQAVPYNIRSKMRVCKTRV